LSLALSGFVEPSARYHLIRSLQSVVIEAVRDGELSAGRFYDVGDTTFYATSGRLNRAADNIFMYRERADNIDTVIVAGRLFNAEFSDVGRVGVLLNNVNIYDLPDRSRAFLSESAWIVEASVDLKT
jgi:IS4 transposase